MLSMANPTEAPDRIFSGLPGLSLPWPHDFYSLAKMVNQRDACTASHCVRMAHLSVALGKAMDLRLEQLLALCRGAYLHDIGKIAVPDSILFKKDRLTEAEWEVMKSHTLVGYSICKPVKSLELVLPIIRSHHERWDGTGYPDGLAGLEIPLLARVLQMADIYEALTTKRPYKPAFDHQTALNIMIDETARGWRDPELMKLFLSLDFSATLASPCSEETAPDNGGGAEDFRASLEIMQQRLSADRAFAVVEQ